jgi:hypothetical protein
VSGLTTPSPSNSTSQIPTTFMFGPREDKTALFYFQGYLKTDTGSPVVGATIYIYVGRSVEDLNCKHQSAIANQ